MYSKITTFTLLILFAFSLGGCVSKVITTPIDIVVDTTTDVIDIVTP